MHSLDCPSLRHCDLQLAMLNVLLSVASTFEQSHRQSSYQRQLGKLRISLCSKLACILHGSLGSRLSITGKWPAISFCYMGHL